MEFLRLSRLRNWLEELQYDESTRETKTLEVSLAFPIPIWYLSWPRSISKVKNSAGQWRCTCNLKKSSLVSIQGSLSKWIWGWSKRAALIAGCQSEVRFEKAAGMILTKETDIAKQRTHLPPLSQAFDWQKPWADKRQVYKEFCPMALRIKGGAIFGGGGGGLKSLENFFQKGNRFRKPYFGSSHAYLVEKLKASLPQRSASDDFLATKTCS